MPAPATHDRRPRVAIVLWDGEFGGTELLSAGLAAAMRRMGVETEVVFITHAGPLADRLRESGVPFQALGFQRGRDVARHPRAYAAALAATGRDGAILPERGFIGAALRAGGYRAPIVAVEHGALLLGGLPPRRRLVQAINTIAGAWADDVEVGVSDFMVGRMRRAPHARRLRRIYNGIDPRRFTPAEDRPPSEAHGVVVGFAGRLIPGKGADDALASVAAARPRAPLTLRIAGEGPERDALQALAHGLGVGRAVEFLGLVRDMPGFWAGCDLALFPSHRFIESFGMGAIEAMACGKPVLATRNGALPEVVLDGVTGTIVAPGDVAALTQALIVYTERPELRRSHGEAGRARSAQQFHIDLCARRYLECLGLR